MPEWLAVIFGIVGGLTVLAGVLYVAVRREFRPKPHRSWLPKADQEHREHTNVDHLGS
jgi:hypothetical protein